MQPKHNNPATARQIELIIRKLTAPATMPATLAAIIPLLKNPTLPISQLAEIISADPSLTAQILSLTASHSIKLDNTDKNIITHALSELPEHVIRQAILSTKVFQPITDASPTAYREKLLRFSITTACIAEKLADIALDDSQKDLAFTAALLHNIGKLALDDAMPKSFEKILTEAQMLGLSDIETERKYLGIDHTIIGKRLAEKWRLPQPITNSIWLHRSDTNAINTSSADIKFISIIRLAYLIARSTPSADPASYEPPADYKPLAAQLEISNQQINGIKRSSKNQTDKCVELLKLDNTSGSKEYSTAVWDLATKLSKENSVLLEQNKDLALGSNLLNFSNDFFKAVNDQTPAVDIAAHFATLFQKTYNTGPICVYLTTQTPEKLIDAVLIDSERAPSILLMNKPQDADIVPDSLKEDFAVINPADNFNWLFQQLNIDFDLSHTKAAPVIASGKTVAIMLFQLNYIPQDLSQLNKLSAVTSLAGPVIALANANTSQQKLAEQFATLLTRLGNIKEKLTNTENLESIAEIAAGAAHELNNPLTIISGRIQMMKEKEKTQYKLEALDQIQKRTEEVSEIISDLMLFAKPKDPDPRPISPVVLIDTAIDHARNNSDIKNIELHTDHIENLRDVYIDPDQIKIAIANLITNAYESYHNTGTSSVTITGAEQNTGTIRIQIIDQGCGMDFATLEKAPQPFFSGKPAGRSRGMGLTHAKRLLQVNNASLHLSSKPSQGTTATILLPCSA